jgi:hypothetical protein
LAATADEAEQDERGRVEKILWRLQQFAQVALLVRPEVFTPCWELSTAAAAGPRNNDHLDPHQQRALLVEFKTASVQLLRHLVRYHQHHHRNNDDHHPTDDRPSLPPEWIRRLTEAASSEPMPTIPTTRSMMTKWGVGSDVCGSCTALIDSWSATASCCHHLLKIRLLPPPPRTSCRANINNKAGKCGYTNRPNAPAAARPSSPINR